MMSESQEAPVGEFKNKRKILQMIRNRISAQTSRDRKKAYLYHLEDTKSKLYVENSLLKQQNSSLLKEIAKLKAANQKMIKQNVSLRNSSDLDIIEINSVNDEYKQRSESENLIEKIVKNMMSSHNLSNAGEKESLNDGCGFAKALSKLDSNQISAQNEKEEEGFIEKVKLNNKQLEEEDEDTRFTYNSDLLNEKQNTIFNHLTGNLKSNKATFFKRTKESFSTEQPIFSLTNFNLTEKTNEYSSLKDLRQDESHYGFGIQHSTLL